MACNAFISIERKEEPSAHSWCCHE